VHNLALFSPHFDKKRSETRPERWEEWPNSKPVPRPISAFCRKPSPACAASARLPAVLDEEVLRVAQEIEDNATRLKQAG